jgi:colicin import membrane protein
MRTSSAVAILLIGLTGVAQAAPDDFALALQQQIAPCWLPPAGATGRVTVNVDFARDGSIVGKPTTRGLASAGLAQAAIRAVQKCAPVKLPEADYAQWAHVGLVLSAN